MTAFGLTMARDTVLVKLGTQFLASRPIWDTVIGTQPSLRQFDFPKSLANQPDQSSRVSPAIGSKSCRLRVTSVALLCKVMAAIARSILPRRGSCFFKSRYDATASRENGRMRMTRAV